MRIPESTEVEYPLKLLLSNGSIQRQTLYGGWAGTAYMQMMYAEFLSIADMQLDRLHWNSMVYPVLTDACRYVPTFVWVGRNRQAIQRSASALTAQLRSTVAYRLRLALYVLLALPLLCLVWLVYIGLELKAGYGRFLAEDLDQLACVIEKDFHIRKSMPSFFAFLRVDLARLHERVLSELKHLKRALARRGQEEAESRARGLKVQERPIISRSQNGDGQPAKNREFRIGRLKYEFEQLAAGNSSAELREQYEAALALGNPRQQLRELGRLVQHLKAIQPAAESKPLEIVEVRTGPSAEVRIFDLDELIFTLLPIQEIENVLPWRIDARVVRAIMVYLLGPGSAESRFDNHYRPDARVRNHAEAYFHRLEGKGKQMSPKAYREALTWLVQNGVVLELKKNTMMYMLTAKYHGKPAAGQALIGLALAAADRIQYGADA